MVLQRFQFYGQLYKHFKGTFSKFLSRSVLQTVKNGFYFKQFFLRSITFRMFVFTFLKKLFQKHFGKMQNIVDQYINLQEVSVFLDNFCQNKNMKAKGKWIPPTPGIYKRK